MHFCQTVSLLPISLTSISVSMRVGNDMVTVRWTGYRLFRSTSGSNYLASSLQLREHSTVLRFCLFFQQSDELTS